MRKVSISILLLFFLISTSSYIFAQEQQPDNNGDQILDTAREKQEEKEDGISKKEERLVFRCSTTSSKMDKLETKYRNNFEKHKSTYLNIIGRINEMLDDLEQRGYDTEEAQAAVDAFQAQVEATQSDFDLFATEFQYSREKICEDDVSGFRESLQQSRNQLKVLRNNMLRLRSEFQQNVKPELLELREQIRQRHEEDESPGDVTLQQKENEQEE